MNKRNFIIAVATSLSIVAAKSGGQPVVDIEDGNVVLKARGHVVELTHRHQDRDPLLSPDATLVVFTRAFRAPDEPDDCADATEANAALWSVRTDGKGERRLVASRMATEPKNRLCGFSGKQFSADGKHLYFESPAWATSAALHVYDFATNAERFVAPSNGYHLITACDEPDYRNTLVVNQHRYFIGGGSYDWYWLLSADGRKQFGPIGENTSMLQDACGIKFQD